VSAVGITTVAFDIGETLVDERRYWSELARRAGVPSHVVWAALGSTIARGLDHRLVWDELRVEPPSAVDLRYEAADLYPDAAGALAALRAGGRRVVLAGNQPAGMTSWGFLDVLEVDVVTTSESLGVRKPAPEFFQRLVELVGDDARSVAYVGDRLDYDVAPSRAAGLLSVHVRRGPWGLLQRTAPGWEPHLTVDSLRGLNEVIR
jgi:FMN phosphatase YigB (HAD superfamily)